MKKFISVLLVLLCCIFAFASCGAKKEPEQTGKVTDFYISKPDDTVPDTEAAAPTVSKVSFAALGDNIIYDCGMTDAANRANAQYPEYNFTPVYSDILPAVQQADLSFINQETLMAGASYGYSDYPCFNSPQTLGDQLCDMGFDIINIANNHMLDMGSGGIEDTINYWNSKTDVTMIGGYLNQEDYQTPRVIEKNGIKIAFLSYTYATNGITLSPSSSVVIPYIDDETIKEDVQRAKAASDMVMVSMHWGQENSFEPSDEQRHTAQLLCDLGVKVIIGHHPHVVQPVEWLESKSGEKTLCIYSLGDLVAAMMKSYNMLGGLATFDIVKSNGDISIQNVLFTPVVHYFGPSYYNSHIYYLSDFTPELGETFGNVYGITDGYDELCGYVKNTVAAEFLPEYLK